MTETIAGVDGCAAGWMAALMGPGDELRLTVVPRFADLFAVALPPAIVAVDMPIGLPDRIGPGGRGPEEAVRPLLGDRQSSVFSVPARAAIYGEDFRAACRLARRVFEVHPEVAFWRMNGERALTEPKKLKGRPYGPGLALRGELLKAAGVPSRAIDQGPPPGAAIDDLLDALACAMTARRIAEGRARPFPDPPGRDAYGLTMAIWA